MDYKSIKESLTEKLDKLKFAKGSKEEEMFKAIIESLGTLELGLNENIMKTDEIDEDLAELEGEYYGDIDSEEEDDELFELTCPHCDSKIFADEEMLTQDVLTCPNCNSEINFDIDLEGCGEGGCDACPGCH